MTKNVVLESAVRLGWERGNNDIFSFITLIREDAIEPTRKRKTSL